MTERRKKAPKIAWRDLAKAGDDAPATDATTDHAPEPQLAERDAVPPKAAKPARKSAKAAAPAIEPAVVAATPVPDATPASDAEASSPRALAERLDEAYAAMVAETAREEEVSAAASRAPAASHGVASAIASEIARVVAQPAARDVAPAVVRGGAPSSHPSVGGPPPELNIAPSSAKAVIASARIEPPTRTAAPAPAQPVAPASVPAATPEAEVQRILARLATYVPVARAAASVADVDSAATLAPAIQRGPMPLEDEDVLPLVSPTGLRDAARTRRGRVELLVFRAGGELFALPLGAVEEAIEAPAIHSLPEMPTAMLGVFNLRERLVPTYSPGASLGVALAQPAGAALLVRSGDRRLALAADDVEDVMELDLSTLRDPPVVEDTDGILLGVARFSRDLVGVLDADALIAACLGGRNVENS
jgi:chemotaxis signal transduction protein